MPIEEGGLYRNILISVDNSEHSRSAEAIGVLLGKSLKAKITGIHVYSGMFHQIRFKILEEHLPDKYQKDEVLAYQQKIHSVLIERGLELISLEYMKNLKDACHDASLPFEEKLVDGKNSDMIIEQAASHDLVVMGALGIGAVPGVSKLGSNTRRVLHSTEKDVLIVKKKSDLKTIVVGIDGSNYSIQTVECAARLANTLGANLHILSCYDPDLHRVIFKSLADVLSEEAGKVFKFKEQEQLHNQVIDATLENLYHRHLENARGIAKQLNISASTELLKGKPYCALCEKAESLDADLLVVGRYGMHRGKKDSIGSNAERLVEISSTNVLVTSATAVNHLSAISSQSQVENKPQKKLVWTEDARKHLENIPSFARPLAVLVIERYAREQGIITITPDVMRKVQEIKKK